MRHGTALRTKVFDLSGGDESSIDFDHLFMQKAFIQAKVDGNLRIIALDRIKTATLTDGRLRITLRSGYQKVVVTDSTAIQIVRDFYEDQSASKSGEAHDAMQWINAPGLLDWLTV